MLFNQDEEARIADAIRAAERGTSGEIRLYVEDYCQRDHPAERAQELFQLFGMYNTQNRNAVLIYLAEKSRQFALWGDAGIHEKSETSSGRTKKSCFANTCSAMRRPRA